MSDIQGLTAVITGAGSGIGRAVAAKLAAAGMKLVLLGGRDRARLAAAAAGLASYSEVLALPGDLTDLTTHAGFAAAAAERFGGIDVLVNNAGMTLNAGFAETDPQAFDAIMNINVRVPYFLTQTFLPLLRQSAAATVINIASVVAHAGYPRQSAYSASKHALLGFTKALAAEYYGENIRVHAISPGGVYTEMVKISRPDLTPEGMTLPEDIAEIVHFLLTHRNNAVIDEICTHRVNKQPFLI